MDRLKPTDSRYRYKSRLGAQNRGDNQAAYIATKAPKAQRLTQRLIRFLASSTDHLSPRTRDIIQAYI